MKILVTGGTGFIGSHLVEKLLNEGHKVKVLVRESESNGIKFQNKDARAFLKELDAEICYGDLTDKDSLLKAVNNVDAVFHLAAIARPMEIPDKTYFIINEQGTKNLLESCKNKKLKKIVIMSSVSAVGPTHDENPVNEKSVCKPIDIYGWSKLAAEKAGFEYIQKYKLPIVFLRPPMVFGPRDFEMLRWFKFISKRFFPIKGNKEGLMEFLYVENLIEACLLALTKGKTGEIYHITNEKHYTVDEIVSAIAKAEGIKVLPIKFPKFSFIIAGYAMEFFAKLFGFHPLFKHDTVEWMTKKFWYSDCSKAKKELGYTAKISLDEGVKKTVEYYKLKGYIK